jgi:hypothetical protein
MDRDTQRRVVMELVKLGEEFNDLVAALLCASQQGLVISNLRPVVFEFRDELARALEGTV